MVSLLLLIYWRGVLTPRSLQLLQLQLLQLQLLQLPLINQFLTMEGLKFLAL